MQEAIGGFCVVRDWDSFKFICWRVSGAIGRCGQPVCVKGGEKMYRVGVGGWPGLDLVGEALAGDAGVVNAERAIVDGELAEPAVGRAGDRLRRIRRGDAVNECDQASDKALVQPALGDALHPVEVVDLAGDVGTAVLFHRPGQGVHVDHHLGDVNSGESARTHDQGSRDHARHA